ncbi:MULTISPECIES: S1C family serine protease [Bacillus cereus group]|uniref:Serine protease n=1 Tax=Bacillus thuringiensis serovar toumanoffi TaxID=180862 RepID=A0ABD5I9L4_BACTU|nr:trypsin-like peptidase domain-containing protein [Bacillus thuringiensis]MCU5281818.1 trypsin-like peptidase domain-containing protein [Bacillus cereus]AMR88633.1 serine protease [Bacillus thuringiensis]EEM92872.1 Serine protease [Bacillus thuringiensis IBL 200]KIP26056.1 PDZ domain protein [Bacillus thuringiensis serovar morrisoni]MBG9640159.1 serine protease [Bacillus thuringiensis]
MGYYDENSPKKEMEKGKKTKNKRYFLVGFTGAIVGALSMNFATPYIYSNNTTMPTSKITGTSAPIATKVTNHTDISNMIEGAKQVVVGVITLQQNMNPFDIESKLQEQEVGSGSGVIYKKTGDTAYIVTNNHVVEGANKLMVKLNDGKQVEALLVGTDPLLDLAVLKIKESTINKVATLGDSNTIHAGDTAIAIGNPLGLDGSVTKGIISSKEREIPVQTNDGEWQAQVIQTDAAINPGNSGGALFNQNGEVIGINSSKIAKQSVEGIGFAIPINIAKPIIESLEVHGVVKRPSLGISVTDIEKLQGYTLEEQLKLPKEVTNGVLIRKLNPASSAEKAGLQLYDAIVALDKQKIENSLQLRKYLYEKKKVGDNLTITFYRNGEKITKTVKLAGN